MQKRYRKVLPDVLILVGVEAVDFWFARRDRLFPGTPVVFGGVGVEEFRSLEGLPGVTGVPMDITPAPVIESLLAMRPQTRQIVLVHGSSEFDRSWREIALRQGKPFADRVEIIAFPELPLEDPFSHSNLTFLLQNLTNTTTKPPMKSALSSIPASRVARMLLLVLAASGIATFFTACYGPAYRHGVRVDRRIDRRDYRWDRREDRWDRRRDRWD